MSNPTVELGRVSGPPVLNIEIRKARAYVTICPEFRIYTSDYPNGFWRFWQWLLLGWRWRRL
jgi:hypothetical protein